MENQKLRSTGLGLAIVLLSCLGLTGCDNDQPQDETPSSTAPTATPTIDSPAPSPEPAESSAEPDSAPSASGPPSATAGFDKIFQSITDAATQTLECLDDDDSGREDSDDLTLSDNDMVISITGDCDDVVVTGNNLTISIVEVDDLKVRGNNNVIAVQDLDDIKITGSDNTIGWNPVHEDDPDREDEGSNNTMRHDALQSLDLKL